MEPRRGTLSAGQDVQTDDILTFSCDADQVEMHDCTISGRSRVEEA